MSISSTEFSAMLRAEGEKLASGEKESIIIVSAHLDEKMSEGDRKKITPAYIRMVLNRVPGIKAIGSVKIRRTRESGIGAEVIERDGYEITLNREPKRKVITSDDIPAIEQKAVAKFVKRLLLTMPNIADLQGEALQGAATGIQRYQEMIKSSVGGDE